VKGEEWGNEKRLNGNGWRKTVGEMKSSEGRPRSGSNGK